MNELGILARSRVTPYQTVNQPQPAGKGKSTTLVPGGILDLAEGSSFMQPPGYESGTRGSLDLKRGVFRSIVDLQATINRFLSETTTQGPSPGPPIPTE
jgi:hypothetical protein